MKYFDPNNLRKLVRASSFSNFLNLGSIQLYNTALSFLVYPIILRQVGLDAFGLFSTANYFAILIGTLVNYGTSQTGIRDIATAGDDQQSLSQAFFNTIFLRILIFIAFVSIFIMIGAADLLHYNYFLFAIPLIFAEVLNPLFLYLGKEKLFFFNISTLLGKLVIILMVVFFLKESEQAILVNFFMGAIHCLIYTILIIRAVYQYKMKFQLVRKRQLRKMLTDNFYLVVNNLSVNLQQSLMVFSIGLWGNPAWLGAYTICDKIVGALKTLVSTISNAIFPKAAQLFMNDREQFKAFARKIKLTQFAGFLGISIILMLSAPLVIRLVNGEPNQLAEDLLRIMAFLPAVAAINSINVLELLIRNQNVYIFKIALVLVVLAAVLCRTAIYFDNLFFFASYTLIIEVCAILMYEYTLRRERNLS